MFYKLIRNRRSVRSFLEKAVDEDKIEALKEAALRAPSSRSLNPWEFIFVNDPDKMDNLSRSKPHGSSFLKSAPLGIAVVADPEKCDVWVEDSSIAAIYLQLAAESLGLKSCWCQIRERQNQSGDPAQDFVKKILGIPKNHQVLCIIGIGYPAKVEPGHGDDYVKNQMNKIHNNNFKG